MSMETLYNSKSLYIFVLPRKQLHSQKEDNLTKDNTPLMLTSVAHLRGLLFLNHE